MAKDSTVRINGVLAFISNCGLLTANERTSAHQLATNFVNNRYPPGNAGQMGYENFSNGMSLGYHTGTDPNNYRNMKRATYLLALAINDVQMNSIAAINPGQILDGAATVAFQDMLRKAACMRDAQTGSDNAAQQALNALYNFPLHFLATNKVIVLGSAIRDATQGDQNVLQFCFGYNPGGNRYVFQPVAPLPGVHQVDVDSVVAQNWTTAGDWLNHPATNGDFRQIRAIELASQFMVTTQFTGCSFCMKRHNGHVYCAHVAPQRDPAANAAPVLTGTQVAQRIANNGGVAGDFANAAGGGPLSIYGAAFSSNIVPGGYPNGLGGGVGYMTIVGVQRGPDYEIYSQVTQNSVISAYQRIF
jgi:hypothetical protein